MKKEDREDRLRIVEEKKKKYGKKISKKGETKDEKKINDEKLAKKLDLLEIKTNMWKMYRIEGGKFVKLERKKEKKKLPEDEETRSNCFGVTARFD